MLRIKNSCFKVTYTRSLTGCLSTCQSDGMCTNACLKLEPSGITCIHIVNCDSRSGIEKNNKFCDVSWVKSCLYGRYNYTSGQCDCNNAVYGLRCDHFRDRCDDLKEVESLVSNFIDLDGDMLDPMVLGCSKGGAIRVVENNGMLNFNQTFGQYLWGFSLTFENMWIGLENLHLLNKAGYTKVRITLSFKTNSATTSTPNSIYRTYSNFTVRDKSKGFAFTVGLSRPGVVGSPPQGSFFGDCLSENQNIPLSTWDDDRDKNPVKNCALMLGVGWWHSDCPASCNLLGQIHGGEYQDTTDASLRLRVHGVDDSTWPMIESFTMDVMRDQ